MLSLPARIRVPPPIFVKLPSPPSVPENVVLALLLPTMRDRAAEEVLLKVKRTWASQSAKCGGGQRTEAQHPAAAGVERAVLQGERTTQHKRATGDQRVA